MSRIIVKSTNLPKRGTTKLVGGIISASRRKNTVSDSRIDMAKLTCKSYKGKTSRSFVRRDISELILYLLAGIGWQIEDQYGEECNANARNDEIDGVK